MDSGNTDNSVQELQVSLYWSFPHDEIHSFFFSIYLNQIFVLVFVMAWNNKTIPGLKRTVTYKNVVKNEFHCAASLNCHS